MQFTVDAYYQLCFYKLEKGQCLRDNFFEKTDGLKARKDTVAKLSRCFKEIDENQQQNKIWKLSI